MRWKVWKLALLWVALGLPLLLLSWMGEGLWQGMRVYLFWLALGSVLLGAFWFLGYLMMEWNRWTDLTRKG